MTPDRAQVDESDKSSSTNLFKSGLSPINGTSPKPFETELVEETPSFKREETSTKRNVSPLITPKMTQIPQGPMHNKSRSGSGIRQFSDSDNEGEWKQSKLKKVSFTNQVKRVVNNSKTFDEMLVPRRSRSSAPEGDSSYQQITEDNNPFAVTDGAAIEEKKEEENSSNGGLPPDVDKDHFLATAPLLTQSPRNKLGLGSGRQVQKTPTNGSNSSSSDMRELKLALGSDRSNGNGHFVFNPNENLYEHNGVIFSDEGSEDSLARDVEEDLAAGDAIWAKVEERQNLKPSLNYMRMLSKKMNKGDATDQAIQKVLQNLVNDVLHNFDPSAVEND